MKKNVSVFFIFAIPIVYTELFKQINIKFSISKIW